MISKAYIHRILTRPVNSDRELYAIAQKIGLKDLNVVYLSDYENANRPTIINIGNRINGGTHFVCAYKDYYFDPFGMLAPPVKDLTKKQHTEIDIQDLRQGHCGVYCVLFLYYATRGKIPEFYSLFKPLN